MEKQQVEELYSSLSDKDKGVVGARAAKLWNKLQMIKGKSDAQALKLLYPSGATEGEVWYFTEQLKPLKGKAFHVVLEQVGEDLWFKAKDLSELEALITK